MKHFLKNLLVLIIILGVLAVGWVVLRSYSRSKASFLFFSVLPARHTACRKHCKCC